MAFVPDHQKIKVIYHEFQMLLYFLHSNSFSLILSLQLPVCIKCQDNNTFYFGLLFPYSPQQMLEYKSLISTTIWQDERFT